MVVTKSYYAKSPKELAGTAGVRLIDRDRLQSYLDDYNQKLIVVFQAEEESAYCRLTAGSNRGTEHG